MNSLVSNFVVFSDYSNQPVCMASFHLDGAEWLHRFFRQARAPNQDESYRVRDMSIGGYR